MTYADVTLSPDDIEFERWPDRERIKDAVYDDHMFELFVIEHGLHVALELVTQFHREVANQLIVRAVTDPRSSRWAGRTIGLCRRVKLRRNQLRRLLTSEIGWDECGVIIRQLDEMYPRATWGADL